MLVCRYVLVLGLFYLHEFSCVTPPLAIFRGPDEDEESGYGMPTRRLRRPNRKLLSHFSRPLPPA